MSKKLLFLTAIVLAVIVLSGCSSGAVRGSTWPGLAASNDAAYLADGAFLYAVNLKDGSELWRYPDQRGTKFLFYTTPYITPDGLVIIGSSGSSFSLMALDPTRIDATTKSPSVVWSFSDVRNHWIAAPLAIGDRLYAPNSDGKLYVLDLKNGQLIKSVELADDLWAQPVTDGKNIFISSLDHSMIALDKDSLQVLWHKDLGSAITSPPILASNGNLYVGSFASNLEEFNPANGNNQSVQKTTDWVWGTPGEIEKNLYFGDLSGNFYSYNLETGKYNWNSINLKPDNWAPNSSKAPDESKETAITTSPIEVNGNILVATESGAIYKVDKEGNHELWGGQQQQPGGKIYTTPVMASDLVLVSPMTADALLYAYDLNGNQKWAFKPAK
ncbi:MAG: PQQ-binding-like beta-propeller repeat protein [Syntrophothermus sp.]